MPPNNRSLLRIVKHIIECILRQTIVRVIRFCLFAKSTADQTSEVEVQNLTCRGESRKDMQVEPETGRVQEVVMSESQLGNGLHRTNSSTILNSDWVAASIQLRKERQRRSRQEEQELDVIEHPPQENCPLMKKLNSKRKRDKERLKECRELVNRETCILKNWEHFQERIPVIFANDPCAKKSAERNFPIGSAQQIHRLRGLSKYLRSWIYDASDGKCDLGAEWKNEVPIERRVHLLVKELEECSRNTFEVERRRLVKMKRVGAASGELEEGRKIEECRNDSAVVCDGNKRSSIVDIGEIG